MINRNLGSSCDFVLSLQEKKNPTVSNRSTALLREILSLECMLLISLAERAAIVWMEGRKYGTFPDDQITVLM